jgi:hypothetical protein
VTSSGYAVTVTPYEIPIHILHTFCGESALKAEPNILAIP